MTTVGEVKNIKIEHEIEWKILNFPTLSDENSINFYSPIFSFCNETWCLRMCPNGATKTAVGYISLFLRRKSSGSHVRVKYSLGLKTLKGQKDCEKHYKSYYSNAEEDHGWYKHLLRSHLFENKADLLPADVITVFCSLTFPASIETPEKVSNGKCYLCEKDVDVDNFPIHQKKDKAIKCADCSAILCLQNLCDHECRVEETDRKTTTILNNGTFSEDFKEMLRDGMNHDLILKIGDKEIKAHKDVLRARSQVFKTMLDHDMKERNTGIIDVSDCDPQAMEVFLSYVYSGKIEALQEINMLQVYYIADKYQMLFLKNECCNFIKGSLSPTNFCDVIQLALNHSDSDLINFATEYFMKNALAILQVVEWQSFLINNPTVANELFIKYCKIKQ